MDILCLGTSILLYLTTYLIYYCNYRVLLNSFNSTTHALLLCIWYKIIKYLWYISILYMKKNCPDTGVGILYSREITI